MRRAGLFVVALAAACASSRPPAVPTPTTGSTDISTGSPAPVVTVPATQSPALPQPSATWLPPTPSSTPAPELWQLTSGGCCVQPLWSADGNEVWYIDRPSALDSSGLWGVPAAGGQPRLVTERIGLYSADRSMFAYPDAGQTYIERSDNGERWVAPSQGRPVAFSPDGTQIAWQIASSSTTFDRRTVEVWVAGVDGANGRQVTRLVGGGLAGWFPDGARLLVQGRQTSADGAEQQFLAALDPAAGSLTTIVTAPQIRGQQISPGGVWIAYLVTFSGDPDGDGLWVVRADGAGARRLDLFGAFRWRDDARLVVVPLELSAGSQRIVELQAENGAQRALTDAAVTPLHIAGGDWALSPDGKNVAFVNAVDRNIWVLALND